MEITEDAWHKLHALAVEAMTTAYAPYSGYPVGAAILTEDGHFYSGCNVENASYPVGLCAECGAVSQMMRAGGGKIAAFAAVNGNREAVVPCGRCRQLLSEHSTRETLLAMPSGILSFAEVLPYSFGGEDLGQVPTSTFKEPTDD